MNPIKSPHQILLEKAGLSLDPSPGLVNTPQQMLMQQANVLPQYATGGSAVNMATPSSLPNINFDVRSIPSMTGQPGVGYMQTPQGAMARLQMEKELENARLRAGVSAMGMSIPGQQGVKVMPGQMDIGANMQMGPGNLDLSANRSINPIPGRGHMQGVRANYSIPFANGGSVYQNLSPADMQAAMIVSGQTPQRFATGSLVKNIGTQTAMNVPFMAEDATDIAKDIKNKKYKEAAAKTAGVGYSAFTPFNPLTALISGLTYSPETGDATLDAYKKQQEEKAAMAQARARALSPVFKRDKPPTLNEMQHEVFGYPNIQLPQIK